MQNILAGWLNIVEQGIYHIPYPAETRLSLVDLTDVAESAARVLLEPSHIGAIYELVGSERLSQSEIATILEEKLNRPVRIEQTSLEDWQRQGQENGLGSYQIDTLIKMFRYYSAHGLYGNAHILSCLLQRPPVSFEAFVERAIHSREEKRICLKHL
jgi:nucleoside-diphosphate-sugar epimerase